MKKKCRNCGGKEKAAEHYTANKDAKKEKANDKYKNLSEEEKKAKRKYSKDRNKKIKKIKLIFVEYKNQSVLVNREKILKHAWDKYHNKRGKEKAPRYYAANKEV